MNTLATRATTTMTDILGGARKSEAEAEHKK